MEDLLKQYPVDKVRKVHEEMQRKARAVFKLHDEQEKEKSEEMERKKKQEERKRKWDLRRMELEEREHKEKLKDHSTCRVSTEQTLEKRGKHEEVSNNVTRTCSVCKLAKSTEEFSKNQRGKGAAAKCKDCIATMQQRIKEAQEIKKQKASENAKAQAENKMMEVLDERQCAKCRM